MEHAAKTGHTIFFIIIIYLANTPRQVSKKIDKNFLIIINNVIYQLLLLLCIIIYIYLLYIT